MAISGVQSSLESNRAHLQRQLRQKDGDCNRMAVQIRVSSETLGCNFRGCFLYICLSVVVANEGGRYLSNVFSLIGFDLAKTKIGNRLRWWTVGQFYESNENMIPETDWENYSLKSIWSTSVFPSLVYMSFGDSFMAKNKMAYKESEQRSE